jgi:hypothetical protein
MNATSHMGMTELRKGIDDPLATVEVVARLVKRIESLGLSVGLSHDMHAFYETRIALRNEVPSPMFDPNIGELSDKSFWVYMKDDSGSVKCIQACRLDFVDTCLADWATGWMTGLYLKRNELMVPEHLSPPKGSKSWKVRGWLVYHGEMWIDREYRGVSNIFDNMASIAVFLAYIKWHPDAVWGLVSTNLAMKGQGNRMSYPRVERSFLRWSWPVPTVPENEWLVLSEREDLEFIIRERLVSGLILKED